jgi:hypothetical protein
MSVHSYEDLVAHVDHALECVRYGSDNVVIECVTCNEILVDYDKEAAA